MGHSSMVEKIDQDLHGRWKYVPNQNLLIFELAWSDNDNSSLLPKGSSMKDVRPKGGGSQPKLDELGQGEGGSGQSGRPLMVQ